MDRRESTQSKAPAHGESRTLIAFFGHRLVRLLVVVALLLFTLFSLTGTARAQTLVRGDSVPAGTTVESDALLSGDEVSIDGRVIGDALVIGSSVEINGEVDGSIIAVGESVVINGEVGGNVYSLAVSPLALGPEASIGRTLYFIGGRLDHSLAALHALLANPDRRIVLAGEEGAAHRSWPRARGSGRLAPDDPP